MRHTAILLLVLLGLTPAAVAGAEQPGEGAARPSLFERLGRPARPDAVRALVAEHRDQDTAALLRLATALGVAGGPAAIDGLVALAERGDASVRSASFRAAERIGLRNDKLRAVVRWSLGRRSAPDRAAAVAALGTTGDGRDVEDLLRMADDAREEGNVRLAAFGALRKLSGEAKPYRIERWRSWWSTVGREGPASVMAAIKTFEEDPEQRLVAAGILARYAWIRLAFVSRRVTAWLRDEDVEVRLAAARIAEALRSAELASRLADAWDASDEDSPFRNGAEAAMASLGARALTKASPR